MGFGAVWKDVQKHILVSVEVGCRGRVDTNSLYFLCEWGDSVGSE